MIAFHRASDKTTDEASPTSAISPIRSIPKGGTTPKVAAAKFQKEARDARRSDMEFILYLEKLIAFGFRSRALRSVMSIRHNANTFRDLPKTPTRPRSPYKPARAAGVGREARRAEITPAFILSKCKDRTLNEALDAATPAELARLETELPGLLDARDAVRDASDAKDIARRAAADADSTLAIFDRLNPGHAASAFRGRLVEKLRNAERRRTVADAAYRNAADLWRMVRGLPPARERGANKSRQRKPSRGRPAPLRFPRMWETDARRNAASKLLKGSSKLPTWGTLGSEGFVYFALLGCGSLGQVQTFNLRLDAKTEALARTKPNPAAWMRDRIETKAAKALDREVHAFVVPEVDGKGKLHFHGFVTASKCDLPAIAEAMCQAAGPWLKWRNMQVTFHPDPPDTGWVSYLLKDWDKASPWPRYSAGHAMSRAAKAAFNAMRTFVLECDSVGPLFQSTEEQSASTSNVDAVKTPERCTDALACPSLDG